MKITLLLPMLLLVGAMAPAQLPNAKTETFRISGNCDRCKQAIEAAGTEKGEAALSWNADTHLAALTYDSAATTADAILKRIAYAGYDNERYLAPAEAYATLEDCCQYERAPQAAVEQATSHAAHSSPDAGNRSAIDNVLLSYFKLKEALVAGNGKNASAAAAELAKQLGTLSEAEAKKANTHASAIAKATDLEDQRARFAGLSESLYNLVKTTKPSSTVYYQHCPMYNKGKGANWLSREKSIRNPYYGDQMLTCGSVVETLGGNNAGGHTHH